MTKIYEWILLFSSPFSTSSSFHFILICLMKMNDKYMGRKDYNISKKKKYTVYSGDLGFSSDIAVNWLCDLGGSHFTSLSLYCWFYKMKGLGYVILIFDDSNFWQLFIFKVKGWRVSTSMHCQWWLFFFILLPSLGLSCSIWDIVPWPRIEPRPLALEA